MRLNLGCAAGTVLLLLLSSLVAAAHAAPAPTIISSCPAVISTPGFYEVQNSNGIAASGNCVTIKARNVTLGIDAYIVNNGASKTGIGIRILKGAIGAVIRGAGSVHHLEGFAIGVEDDAGDAVIGDLTILSTANVGLLLKGTSPVATMLDDIYVQGPGTTEGIHVTAPAGVRMVDTSVYQVGTYGILLDAASSGSVLGGVTSAENTGTNIDIAGSGNVISYCGEGYGQYGIVIEKGAGQNLVTGCSSSGFQAPSVEDAVDNNPSCGTNAWFDDNFASTNRACINHPAGGTAISSCQTIANGGGYLVTGNLTSASGDCLDITGANITLYLANHTITGSKTGIGVHVLSTATGFRGIGGTSGSEIYGFATGAEIDADGAIFDDTGAENAADTGILVKGAKDVTLGANDGSSNGKFGYQFLNASRTLLHNYSALSNGIYGVFIERSTGSLLDQFEAGSSGDANGIAGIYLGCSLTGPGAACTGHPSTGNKIAHGSLVDNTQYGLVVDAGSDKNVLANIGTSGNGTDDVYDGNSNCADNLWFFDTFTTSNNASCMNQP